MKILKLPKSRNKTLHIKEKCDHCKTKVLINDLIDVIPGSIVLNDDGCETDYQNFQYICPNCGCINDVKQRIKLSKYLKDKSVDLYDQVRDLGEMMISWITKYDRSTRDLYKIMCLVAATGTRIDPELMNYKEYKFIHDQMINGELPYEYDDKTYISFTFNAHNIHDNITNITTSSNCFIRTYKITWSDGTIMDIKCIGSDGEIVTRSIRQYPLYSDRHY